MKQVAFLSTDNLHDFFVYDSLCYAPLAALGWQARDVSWHAKDICWDQFDVVVIRSTWDYQDTPQEFLACLSAIDSSSARLENSLALVKWNLSKNYLKDLQQHGVNIVPTLWFERFEMTAVKSAFAELGSDEIVIKPTISANADHTYRLTLSSLQQHQRVLAKTFQSRAFMLQPFLPSVVQEGEYSLFYFAQQYSHCIVKVPKQDDFRVQEEHGGQLKTRQATTQQRAIAERALAALPESPLYARVDLIRVGQQFAVMEIELIEPSLYFNMDQDSASRFSAALDNKYREA